MVSRLFITLITSLAVGTSPASAKTYEKCLTAPGGAERLAACENAISGGALTDEQQARAHRERGSLLAEGGSHTAAIEAFDAAIALKKNDARSFEKRGMAHLVLGDLARAIADLDMAIELQPGSSRLLTVRGYARLVDGKPELAIADFNEALKLKPDNAVSFNNRGLAYRKMGNLAEALKDYEAAIALQPTYALAHANRGYVLEALGQKEQAAQSFVNALRIDPRLSGAAEGLQRLGNKEAGAQVVSTVAEGRTLATLLCSRCHAIDQSSSSPNPKAPPFRTLEERYPLLDIREPIDRGIAAPHEEMPAFKLATEDVDKIIAFVNSLNSE